eukprot:904871-Pleurochrysis_carterae.AAC.1
MRWSRPLRRGVPPIVFRGKGNAIVVAAGGAVIEFINSLLAPDLVVKLASVEQAMVQNKVKVCFGDHLDMLFHKHKKPIPFDAGYALHVRPLNSAEFEYICKEHHGVTFDIITRGKAAGGPSAKLSLADTAWLWGARLPSVSAERMRHAPDVTVCHCRCTCPARTCSARPIC